MRDILFRGKRKDNGEWETGSLVRERLGCSDEKVFIANTEIYTRVIPETVGQYTGLKVNGQKVFEGDILKGKFCNYVIWFDEAERAFVYGSSYLGGYKIAIANYLLNSAFNIIGNIHDNPELVEVQQ